VDRLKIILVSLFLLVVAGSVAGVPAMVHLCCNEPSEEACAPEACCGDMDSEATEDGCCDTQVVVRALEDDASMPTAKLVDPPSSLIDVVPLDHGSLTAGRRPLRLIAHAAQAPDPPPERSVLSIYRI